MADQVGPKSNLPIGLFIGMFANCLAVCAGGVFFLVPPGSRFRGMEPAAECFFLFFLLGTAVGLLGGLPFSVRDLYWRRRWVLGTIGLILAFTPPLTAGLLMELAAWQLNLIWD